MADKRLLNIAVLFDGAGLARLGLEQAGHTCTGFELDPAKHHLSKMVGSGNSVLADVRDVDLSGFDAVWASPPCQQRSSARTQGAPVSDFADDLLQWSLTIPERFPNIEVSWVENVRVQKAWANEWGTSYNAAQFEWTPRQNRTRVIGGDYRYPKRFRDFASHYGLDTCPCVTATEYKGCATDKRRASRWYGRRLSVRECAYHMGFEIPEHIIHSWWYPLPRYTAAQWRNNLYEAIGNGVPVYMARAFGEAYSKPDSPTHFMNSPLRMLPGMAA